MKGCKIALGALLCASTGYGTVAHAQGGPVQTQGTPAAADQAAKIGTRDVEDIVVTAQFRGQSVQTTPLAITALSGAELESRGMNTGITRLSDSVPNLLLKSTSYSPAVNIFIRGVGQDDTSAAVEPGVGVYIDDVYIPTLVGAQMELLDLDRIEVLKGPQGTLAGRNSMGGAVKLFTKKPGDAPDGSISAEYGRFDRVALRGGTNFTLVKDKLYGRISGLYRSQKGYVTQLNYACSHPGSLPSSFAIASGSDCVIGHMGGEQIGGVRAALRWIANDAIEVNLAGDYTRQRNEPTASTLLATMGRTPTGGAVRGEANLPYSTSTTTAFGGSPFISYSPFPGIVATDPYTNSPYVNYATFAVPYGRTTGANTYGPYSLSSRNDLDSYGVSLTVDWRLSENVALRSITGYRAYNTDYTADIDLSPYSSSVNESKITNWAFSQELRLSGHFFDDAINATLGGIYAKQSTTQGGLIESLSFAALQNDQIPATSKAVFAHVDWRIANNFHILGGIRYTTETKNYIFRRSTINGQPNSTVFAINGFDNFSPTPYSGSNVDYRLAAQYNITPTIMAYAQFATGYKGGGINPRPFNVAQALAFGPEHLNAYELGLKTSFLDRRVTFNVAAFLNEYKDRQVAISTCSIGGPGPCNLIVNAGTSDLKGVEIETRIRPLPGLSIDASTSWLDFQYKSLPASVLALGVTSSMKLPYVWKDKWNVGVEYRAELGSFGSLTPRIDVAHQSGFYVTAVNFPVYGFVPAYTIGNARLSWQNKAEDLEVALVVNNVTDEIYYNNFYVATTALAVNGQIAKPREWFLSVKKSF